VTTHPLYRPPRKPVPDPRVLPHNDRALIRELLDPTVTRAEADRYTELPRSAQSDQGRAFRPGRPVTAHGLRRHQVG